MVWIHTAALVASLAIVVSCMDFVNPPRFGEVGDFSSNPTYAEGARVNVIWDGMDKGRPVTLTLTQLNGTEWMLPMEYLTQSIVDRTSYDWLVATGKNLTASNMFFFCIFYEGETSATANSHYFNITPKAVNQPSSSSTPSPTTLPISSSTSTSLSTSTLPPTAPSNLIPSATPEPASSSSGMGTGAKIGIGVSIPIALFAGLGIGFFLFRRHRNQQKDAMLAGSPEHSEHAFHGAYPHGGYHQERVEGGNRSPVEMGQADRHMELDGGYYGPQGGTYKYGHVAEPGVFHELPAAPSAK